MIVMSKQQQKIYANSLLTIISIVFFGFMLIVFARPGFVNEVGNLAEKEGHHPDVMFGWGYAKVKIFTHKIKGLVESDFILAAKIDKI